MTTLADALHAFRLNDALARDSTILIGGTLVVAVEILIGIKFFGA